MNPVQTRAKAVAFGNEEHPEAHDLDFVLRCGELDRAGGGAGLRTASAVGRSERKLCHTTWYGIDPGSDNIFLCRKRCRQRSVSSPRNHLSGPDSWN